MIRNFSDSRLKCNCNENCFYYCQIRPKNNNSKIEYVIVNKCNRLIEEGSKKIPCKFYNEKILEEKDYIKKNVPFHNDKKKKDIVVTYKDIRVLIILVY